MVDFFGPAGREEVVGYLPIEACSAALDVIGRWWGTGAVEETELGHGDVWATALLAIGDDVNAKSVGTGIIVCTASAWARHGLEVGVILYFWL